MMVAFAGLFSRSEDVARYVPRYVGGLSPGTPLYAGFIRPNGKLGSLICLAESLEKILPHTRALLVSPLPINRGARDTPTVFAAIDKPARLGDRAAYALDATLLAHITSVFLKRGMDPEAATSRTLRKFPLPMSAVFLVKHNEALMMVASSHEAPVWLCEHDTHTAILAMASPPSRGVQRVETGDTLVIQQNSLAILDCNGMRMEKRPPPPFVSEPETRAH